MARTSTPHLLTHYSTNFLDKTRACRPGTQRTAVATTCCWQPACRGGAHHLYTTPRLYFVSGYITSVNTMDSEGWGGCLFPGDSTGKVPRVSEKMAVHMRGRGSPDVTVLVTRQDRGVIRGTRGGGRRGGYPAKKVDYHYRGCGVMPLLRVTTSYPPGYLSLDRERHAACCFEAALLTMTERYYPVTTLEVSSRRWCL